MFPLVIVSIFYLHNIIFYYYVEISYQIYYLLVGSAPSLLQLNRQRT